MVRETYPRSETGFRSPSRLKSSVKSVSSFSRDSISCLVEDLQKYARIKPIKEPMAASGKVPMTKAEIRAVSVAQMELTEDAVVYDIGAGTGSVSVEIALSGEKIKVYAIEKNPEGVELIRQNRKKFRVDGIRIIEGNAPEVLEGLEMPTHVFIGGSSGNLRQIIEKVTAANPEVKIVLNAISLETLGEVMELSKDGLLKEIQVTQLSAARSRILGDYHMMTGQNPVYIIRSERRATET